MGQEITVTDGETVGREVRAAMVEAGAPEEDAVYVHRKHIRIDVTDDGEFVLTRLGENSLTVNGRTVEKGSQVRIADGDEIGFSDVVTATVSIR
jgi:pSer/pThr/pTyr-binding forkhead associated (FHA) protein